MSLENIHDLFLHGAKDLYYAEKKLVSALPKMAKKATSPELKQAIEQHLSETEAMDGLIEEGKEVMEEADEDAALDAGVLAAAQAVEHYEIARYGTLVAWGDELGMEEAVRLLVTGKGMYRMNVPSRKSPIAMRMMPAGRVARTKPSRPSCCTVPATRTMKAPAGTPIWNRLPPSSETRNPPTMAV